MYIDNNGKHQKWLDKTYDVLVPSIGPSETFEGELLRVIDTMYFTYHRDDNIRNIATGAKYLLTHFTSLVPEATADMLLIYRECTHGEFGNLAMLVEPLERVYDMVCEYIINIDSYTINNVEGCTMTPLAMMYAADWT